MEIFSLSKTRNCTAFFLAAEAQMHSANWIDQDQRRANYLTSKNKIKTLILAT